MEKSKEYLKLPRTSAWGIEKDTDNYYPIPLSGNGKEVATKLSGVDLSSIICHLEEIIKQLKISNVHLSLITNEVVEGEPPC